MNGFQTDSRLIISFKLFPKCFFLILIPVFFADSHRWVSIPGVLMSFYHNLSTLYLGARKCLLPIGSSSIYLMAPVYVMNDPPASVNRFSSPRLHFSGCHFGLIDYTVPLALNSRTLNIGLYNCPGTNFLSKTANHGSSALSAATTLQKRTQQSVVARACLVSRR